MTLDYGLAVTGMGVLVFCALAVLGRLLMQYFRPRMAGPSDRGTTGRSFSMVLSEQYDDSIDFSMPSIPCVTTGVYGQAAHLLDRGFSPRQVRREVKLPKGEMELLLRMQNTKSVFSDGFYKPSA